MADDGYRTQKNISFAFLRCIGVSVAFCESDSEYPPDIFPKEKGELPNSIFSNLKSSELVSLAGLLSISLWWCLMWEKSGD